MRLILVSHCIVFSVGSVIVAANSPCEDRLVVQELCVLNQSDPKTWLLVGVYDGHGGWEMADFLAKYLPRFLLDSLCRHECQKDDSKVRVEEAWAEVHRAMEHHLGRHINKAIQTSHRQGWVTTRIPGMCCDSWYNSY
jgi:serine/threonine protein phosphatase PrpC